MTQEQFNSYYDMPSHKEWRREVQKNVMEGEKEEGGTRGGLGSSYKV